MTVSGNSGSSLDRTPLDEKGIGRAAQVLADELGETPVVDNEPVVRQIIQAYLTQPPEWPADESVDFLTGADRGAEEFEDWRGELRKALLADPVIKAAIAWRDQCFPDGEAGLSGGLYAETCALISTLAKAGL